MFEAIGTIINAPAGRPRETTPVRRHSREAGYCEGVFWRKTSREEVRRIVLAARRYELVTRQPGARNGALGFVAVEVLEFLANLVSFRTGRLDPSLDYLMAKLKRSRDAIVTALKALRTHGFLDWLRRYVPTGREGRGPQVQQTSNAYRLSLPARAAQLMGRLFHRPPPPDDHSHAQEGRMAEYERQRSELTPLERNLLDIDPDGPLAETLTRLAHSRALRQERESAKRSESLC